MLGAGWACLGALVLPPHLIPKLQGAALAATGSVEVDLTGEDAFICLAIRVSRD